MLGSIHLLGNIQPFSHLSRDVCLSRRPPLFSEEEVRLDDSFFCEEDELDILLSERDRLELFSILSAEDLSMMLLDMQAIFLNSSSNFFHLSLDSSSILSLTLSKSSQEDLKNGSSKKKSLIVIGTLFPSVILICLFVFRLLV